MNEAIICLEREILQAVQGTKLDRDTYDDLQKKIRILGLRQYLREHPEDPFLAILIDSYIGAFTQNQNLFHSFEISLPLLRQIKVFQNLPLVTNLNRFSFLFELFDLNSFPKIDRGIQEVFQIYKPEVLEHPMIKKSFQFIEENPEICRSSVDPYYDLEQEKEYYRKAYLGEDFQELCSFANCHDLYPHEARNVFLNKRKGNIGEWSVFHGISNSSKIFVAKDCNNGFGYDIYLHYVAFDTNRVVENAIEVKTTTTYDLNTYDSFSLSENEYNVLKGCLDRHDLYTVARVQLDQFLNPNSWVFLHAKSDSILCSDEGIQYSLCGSDTNNKKIFQKKMN